MERKKANISVRIEPKIKEQAEIILGKLGIPISVLIDSLYRQIIMTNGVPFSLVIPPFKTLDSMSEEELNSILDKGYRQSKEGKGKSIDQAFTEIDKHSK